MSHQIQQNQHFNIITPPSLTHAQYCASEETANFVPNPTHTMGEHIQGCDVDTQVYAETDALYITLIITVSWYIVV